MSYFEVAQEIKTMKDTVVNLFGLESKKTIDFFFKADIMNIYSLEEYFYALCGDFVEGSIRK